MMETAAAASKHIERAAYKTLHSLKEVHGASKIAKGVRITTQELKSR